MPVANAIINFTIRENRYSTSKLYIREVIGSIDRTEL